MELEWKLMKLHEIVDVSGQPLLEGGKATAKLGAVRATKTDIDAALAFVSRHLDIGVETLRTRLLGSTRLTMLGAQQDSGDIDLAIHDGESDQALAVKRMTKACGNPPYEIGGSTFSFAVPTGKSRKVQVDLMFVPDIKWALFSHHADERSKHKSGVRNELLHSALKFSMVPGEDVRLKNGDGNDIARASRSYKLDQGVQRLFKVAKMRKDGKGRVKGVQLATADEVRTALDQEGSREKFSPEQDTIRDPYRFAEMLFGSGGNGKDLMTVEQLIELIKKHKRKLADEVLKDAVRGIKRLKFPVPDELKQYET
jgi:hypothetical protein